MKLGMIGLGRMGANMAQRLMRGGHQLGFDLKSKRASLDNNGAQSADSLGGLVAAARGFLMVPAEKSPMPPRRNCRACRPPMMVVDGGNPTTRTRCRAATFAQKNRLH